MDEYPERARPRRGARPQAWNGQARRWPTALAAIAAGAALAVAACGSSASADTYLGGTYRQALAYTKCQRSHGVPQFPAPNAQGNYNPAQVQAADSNPQERNAREECRSLLPNGGSGLSATQIQTIQQQNIRNAVKAADCMRAHGIPNFPDPASSIQQSGVNWQPVVAANLNLDSPAYAAAFRICSAGGVIPPNLAPGSGGG